MMSRKLLGIVIGGGVGGLFFAFVMILFFSPGVFLKGMIKEGLSRAFGGEVRAEGITFGWRRGIELSDFTLLKKGEKKPAFKAQKMRLKFTLLPLVRGQYILRDLEVSDLEVVKGFMADPAMGLGVLELRASHLVFTGELNIPAHHRRVSSNEKEGSNGPVGGGHIILENGLLTGELVSVLMETLGQPIGGYTFESISTNFEAEKGGQVNLKNFLAKGALFDLELEGRVQADQTMKCNATVVISKEKVGEKVQKFFNFSGTNTLRIPIGLKGSLSRPKISIKKESMVEELFKGIFPEK